MTVSLEIKDLATQCSSVPRELKNIGDKKYKTKGTGNEKLEEGRGKKQLTGRNSGKKLKENSRKWKSQWTGNGKYRRQEMEITVDKKWKSQKTISVKWENLQNTKEKQSYL